MERRETCYITYFLFMLLLNWGKNAISPQLMRGMQHPYKSGPNAKLRKEWNGSLHSLCSFNFPKHCSLAFHSFGSPSIQTIWYETFSLLQFLDLCQQDCKKDIKGMKFLLSFNLHWFNSDSGNKVHMTEI